MPATLYTHIARAYRIIGDLTPIPADCGKLCGAACCEGDDDIGMLLFPGEAARLHTVPRFQVTRFIYMDSKAWLLTCDGACPRDLRPLSCRIFPLAPHVDKAGRVTAVPDPRARRLCPLADGKHLDSRFRRRVERAFQELATHPKLLDFMRTLSADLDEWRKLVE